jgi:hypothetical protein
MPGVFDRLNKEIENKQQEGGITPLDLAELPPALRKIMRLMLRELQMNYPACVRPWIPCRRRNASHVTNCRMRLPH